MLFTLGTLSIISTAFLYRILRPVIDDLPWWDSWVAASLFYEFLFVGPIEEVSKFAIFALIVTRRRTIKEPLDGLPQAASVAIAFAAV